MNTDFRVGFRGLQVKGVPIGAVFGSLWSLMLQGLSCSEHSPAEGSETEEVTKVRSATKQTNGLLSVLDI